MRNLPLSLTHAEGDDNKVFASPESKAALTHLLESMFQLEANELCLEHCMKVILKLMIF
jgi:hypothetical protein